MAKINSSDIISDVLIIELTAHGDERGKFVETFRQEWLGQGAPAMLQGNRSDSARGVLRGLHFHRKQSDYWYSPAGTLFVAMHDLRRSSPTFGVSQSLLIGDDHQTGVYIPPGVAHGFQAVTDATLTYLVDNYYDSTDEFGLAWDDPDAAIEWPVANPVLSERDQENPKRSQIAPEDLPA